MHQIMAFGGARGNGSSPFQQAVLQSPDLHVLSTSRFQQEKNLNTFLANANVTTIEEARQLSTAELQLANEKSVEPAPMGTFGFRKSNIALPPFQYQNDWSRDRRD